MGAVSLAQRSGVLGSGIYATQKPNIDVAGAIGAISQALSAQREGAIQRAYLQHQTARQKELDDRALQQQLYERDFQGKQLAQQQALAQGQHDIESRRIESDAENKRQQLQVMKEIAALTAASREAAAKTSAGGRVKAAEVRGPLEGNNPAIQGAKADDTERLATSKDYSDAVKEYMKPTRNEDGSYGKPVTFAQASALAKQEMRVAHPRGAAMLWGDETPPQTTTAQGELQAQALYQHAYNRLDPKDPNFPKQKASLDNALMDRLSVIHSAPPKPIAPAPAATGPAAPAASPPAGTGAAPLPTGNPEDDDQTP